MLGRSKIGGLLAAILTDMAAGIGALPKDDVHRRQLEDAVATLQQALNGS